MKTVVITGASRGIGFTTTKKFLDSGYRVVGTSTSGKIDIESLNLIKIKLDISSPDDIGLAVEEIKKLGIKVDILINNSGVLLDFDDEKPNLDKMRKTLEVNLFGLIDFTEQLMLLINQEGGHIVNVSSMSGSFSEEVNDGYAPAYRISKAALNMYTYTRSRSLKEQNIILSSIDPGWVKTEMGGKEARREPEEVAEDIYNLATRANVESGQFWFKGEKRSW